MSILDLKVLINSSVMENGVQFRQGRFLFDLSGNRGAVELCVDHSTGQSGYMTRDPFTTCFLVKSEEQDYWLSVDMYPSENRVDRMVLDGGRVRIFSTTKYELATLDQSIWTFGFDGHNEAPASRGCDTRPLRHSDDSEDLDIPLGKYRVERRKSRNSRLRRSAWKQRQRLSRSQRNRGRWLVHPSGGTVSADEALLREFLKVPEGIDTKGVLDAWRNYASSLDAMEFLSVDRKLPEAFFRVERTEFEKEKKLGAVNVVKHGLKRPPDHEFRDNGEPLTPSDTPSDTSSLLDTVESVSNIKDQVKNALSKDLPGADAVFEANCHFIERLVLFSLRLSRVGNFMDLLLQVVDFCHELTGKSWMKELLQFSKGLSVPVEATGWGDAVKNIASNTNLINVFKVVAMGTSIVMAGFTNVEWDIELFKGVDFESIKITDMMSMVTESLDWFVKVGYEVFSTRSLMPLVWASPQFGNITTEYEMLLKDFEQSERATTGYNHQELYTKMETFISTASDFIKATRDKASKVTVLRFCSTIGEKKLKVYSKFSAQADRIEPFGVSLYGASSVGKSTIIPYVARACVAGYKEQYKPDKTWLVNAATKHDDGIQQDTQTIVVDDMSNVRAEYTTIPPTDRILRIQNSVALVPNMASVEDKGRLHPEPKCLIVTTNVKHLNAKVFSNEPSSILRRVYHIEMVVNPPFRKPGSTAIDPNNPLLGELAEDGFPAHNIHSFLVQEYIVRGTERDSGFSTIDIADVVEGEKAAKNGWISIRQLHKMLFTLARKKQELQIRQLGRARDLPPLNLDTGNVAAAPSTDSTTDGVHASGLMTTFGLTLMSPTAMFTSVISQYTSSAISELGHYFVPFPWARLQRDVARESSKVMHEVLMEFTNSAEDTFATIVPAHWWRDAEGRPSMLLRCSDRIMRWRRYNIWRKSLVPTWTSLAFGGTIFATLMFKQGMSVRHSLVQSTIATSAVILNRAIAADRQHVARCEELDRRIRTTPASVARVLRANQQNIRHVVTALTVLATIVAIIKVWRLMYHPSGGGSPSWLGFIPESWRGPSPSFKKITPAHAESVIGKNFVSVSYVTSKGTNKVRGLLLDSSHLLTVAHAFTPDMNKNSDLVAGSLTLSRMYKRAKNTTTEKIQPSSIYRIGDQDLVVVYLTRCFQVRDCKDMLCQKAIEGGTHTLRFLGRVDDEDLIVADGKASLEKVGYLGAETQGLKMQIPYEYVSHGNCGAMLLSTGQSSAIQAMLFAAHVGHQGHFELVDRPRVDAVYTRMEADLKSTRSSLADVVPVYGSTVTNGAVHPSAAKIYPEEECTVVHALASTKQRITNKSQIFRGKIADDICEVFGVEEKFGPPIFKGEFEGKKVNPSTAYNNSAVHLKKGADNVNEVFLDMAVEDYLIGVRKLVTNASPLTLEETINGRKCDKYSKAMPMSTSMGFPIFRPKNEYFSQREDLSYEGGTEVLAEFARIHELASRGKRTRPIFSAMLKDEPVTIFKHKVRVFYACPVAFTMLTRKYYLPVVEDLLSNHLESEIAVGLVCSSSQWHKMYKHITRFMTSDKQLFGYDYSKYDLKFSPNVLRAAYKILIELARLKGYSEHDLEIMKVVAMDMCNPFIDWNGTLLSPSCLHASGNSLTAIVNSIVNALLVRACFFEYTHKEPGEFRKHVGLITYGDDGLGSIDSSVRKQFNFVAYQQWLSEIGMAITHPSKVEGSTDFHADSMDFLKRMNTYHEDLGYSVGSLEMDSIFKSLYCRRRVKEFDANSVPTGLTEELVVSGAIDCALHEWFLHGREIYNEMRQKMMIVLERHPGISNSAVLLSYENRVQKIEEYNDLLIEDQSSSD